MHKTTRLPKYENSLVDTCFWELWRTSGHILFLTCNGLYRNAFDNIRRNLESIVRSFYIDLRHPQASFTTKIEILKEVENESNYRAQPLITKLGKVMNWGGYKDDISKEYSSLSQIIHPSHIQHVATLLDIKKGTGVPLNVDCSEISKVYDSLKTLYDIFFFLFVAYFPEVKNEIRNNTDLMRCIKTYNMPLLLKILY